MLLKRDLSYKEAAKEALTAEAGKPHQTV
jgi:hypothetical protein